MSPLGRLGDGEDLERAARVAADPDAAPQARVAALVSVVEAVSLRGVPIPEAVLDAVDDLALVDAAITMRRAGAICAALHQLGRRPELETTRRRVVRRLVAAGVTGTHLAGLAFEIGDVIPGATLAVRDHDEHIARRVPQARPNAIVDAWLGWLASQADVAVIAVLRTLASRGAALDELFSHVTDPTRRDRLSRLARSMLAS